MMREMLYEATQILLVRSAKWSWLKAWAMKIATHRGLKKAIVALARRLAVIMHRIWVDGTEFRCSMRSREDANARRDDGNSRSGRNWPDLVGRGDVQVGACAERGNEVGHGYPPRTRLSDD
jgi:hypothetical protein